MRFRYTTFGEQQHVPVSRIAQLTSRLQGPWQIPLYIRDRVQQTVQPRSVAASPGFEVGVLMRHQSIRLIPGSQLRIWQLMSDIWRTSCSCAIAKAEVAVCGEQHPKTWVWDAKALRCGARRSDRAALQVLRPQDALPTLVCDRHAEHTGGQASCASHSIAGKPHSSTIILTTVAGSAAREMAGNGWRLHSAVPVCCSPTAF